MTIKIIIIHVLISFQNVMMLTAELEKHSNKRKPSSSLTVDTEPTHANADAREDTSQSLSHRQQAETDHVTVT